MKGLLDRGSINIACVAEPVVRSPVFSRTQPHRGTHVRARPRSIHRRKAHTCGLRTCTPPQPSTGLGDRDAARRGAADTRGTQHEIFELLGKHVNVNAAFTLPFTFRPLRARSPPLPSLCEPEGRDGGASTTVCNGAGGRGSDADGVDGDDSDGAPWIAFYSQWRKKRDATIVRREDSTGGGGRRQWRGNSSRLTVR